MPSRYDTDQLTEAQFEQGSRGRVPLSKETSLAVTGANFDASAIMLS